MPLFLIERTFADLVPTDDKSMAAIKLVNDEIGVQWLFSFLAATEKPCNSISTGSGPAIRQSRSGRAERRGAARGRAPRGGRRC